MGIRGGVCQVQRSVGGSDADYQVEAKLLEEQMQSPYADEKPPPAILDQIDKMGAEGYLKSCNSHINRRKTESADQSILYLDINALYSSCKDDSPPHPLSIPPLSIPPLSIPPLSIPPPPPYESLSSREERIVIDRSTADRLMISSRGVRNAELCSLLCFGMSLIVLFFVSYKLFRASDVEKILKVIETFKTRN